MPDVIVALCLVSALTFTNLLICRLALLLQKSRKSKPLANFHILTCIKLLGENYQHSNYFSNIIQFAWQCQWLEHCKAVWASVLQHSPTPPRCDPPPPPWQPHPPLCNPPIPATLPLCDTPTSPLLHPHSLYVTSHGLIWKRCNLVKNLKRHSKRYGEKSKSM